MATVSPLAGAKGAGKTASRGFVYVENDIDFAAAATAKGSALAAGDIIEAVDIPATSMILNAGVEVITATSGGAADVTLDLGVTGVDVDAFVDGFDLDAAAAGAYTQNAAAFQPIVVSSADTVDIEIQTATTAPTAGKVRVWAVYMDVDGRTNADEVDRDQLA